MRISYFMLLVLWILPAGAVGQNALDSDGLRTGPWTGYYADSTIRYEAEFSSGKPVGRMKRYDQQGNLTATMDFYPGSDRCFVKMYAKNGKLKARGIYEKQQKDSTWEYLGSNGTVRMIENYSLGELSGITETFYPSGNISRRMHYKSGIRQGPWIQFFENGDTMLVASYQDDQLHGAYNTFYQEARSQISGKYFRDVKDGDWNYYSEEGELVSVIKYDKGKVLNPEELERKYETFIQQLEETEGSIPDPALGWE